jgi:hypothetical protein
MAIIDEIKELQAQGKQNLQISQELQQKGFSQQDISNALSQSQIKQAVNAPQSQNPSQSFEALPPPPLPTLSAQSTQELPPAKNPPASFPTPPQPQGNTQSMQPSMLSPPSPLEPSTEEVYTDQAFPEPQQDYGYDTQQDYGYDTQQQYDYAPSSISSDTITEISEQVVSEKLANIRKQLEKTIDMKNTFSAQISHIDDRLQRMEKIIDRLQLSILQKVGEYTTSVSDLKKELSETQKSFKAKNHKSSPHRKSKSHKK